MLTPIPSPLDKIKNLRPLSKERVQAFLHRMQTVVIPKIIEEERRQAVLAAEMRNKVLF